MSAVISVLQLKGIDYKDTGGDILVRCLNPDHDDTHPSLRIDRESGVMHCLSCGFGKGIPSIFHYFNEDTRTEPPLLHKVRKHIREILAGSRFLEIPESAIFFDKDYRGIKADLYKKYFAFQHQDWEGRVVFPITDSVGRIQVFLGRSLNGSAPPKYLLKPKNVPAPLFPLRPYPHIVLVEGLFDMLNLEDKGMVNSVACFGTHQFSINNVEEKFMSQIISGTKVAFILLDNDKSGNVAAEKLARLISHKTRIRPIVANHLLPEGKDPGELDQEEVAELSRNLEILLEETD
ncbi:DNA primase [Serratia phage vB_SmaM-Kamaji]|nr:DNA primase [Serratia phage vB_SmaM-Kamaji]